MADEPIFRAGADLDVGDVVTMERVIRRRWWQFWRPRREVVVVPYRVADKISQSRP